MGLLIGTPLGMTAQKGPGYYGTPLRFAPPPVGLDANEAGEARQEHAPARPLPVAPPPQPAAPYEGAKPNSLSPTRIAPQSAPEPVRATERAAPEAARATLPENPPDEERAGAVALTLEGEPEAQKEGARRARGPMPVRLFGTVDFRGELKDLPKWIRVNEAEKRQRTFRDGGLQCTDPKNAVPASIKEGWLSLKGRLQNAPLMEKVKEVNKFFNQFPYRTDIALYGFEDYWATPCQFMNRSGDCEDYAITKYFALRDLGVPADIMRIAAIKDNIRNIGHAVLVIFSENDAYVLDNLTNLVLSHKKLMHYRPIYTVNENFLWRHVTPVSGPR